VKKVKVKKKKVVRKVEKEVQEQLVHRSALDKQLDELRARLETL